MEGKIGRHGELGQNLVFFFNFQMVFNGFATVLTGFQPTRFLKVAFFG